MLVVIKRKPKASGVSSFKWILNGKWTYFFMILCKKEVMDEIENFFQNNHFILDLKEGER